MVSLPPHSWNIVYRIPCFLHRTEVSSSGRTPLSLQRLRVHVVAHQTNRSSFHTQAGRYNMSADTTSTTGLYSFGKWPSFFSFLLPARHGTSLFPSVVCTPF